MSNQKNDVLTPEDLEGQTTLDIKPKKKRIRKYDKKPPLTEEQARLMAEHMATMARHGGTAKMTRINVGYTPSNYEFLRALQDDSHTSLTKLINGIVSLYRMEHEPNKEDNADLIEYIDGHYNYKAYIQALAELEN